LQNAYIQKFTKTETSPTAIKTIGFYQNDKGKSPETEDRKSGSKKVNEEMSEWVNEEEVRRPKSWEKEDRWCATH